MKHFFEKLHQKFSYAIKGIYITIKEEKSMWFHIFSSLLVIIIGILLKLSFVEWSIILIMIGFVISFEILNTAIEAVVDMISFQYNLKVKKIKDISAGATLFVSIISLIVASILLIPKIIEYFN